MAKVSVIIPCYNQGIYILEALESVKLQTHTDCEVIVVNDGSTDAETLKILNSISSPEVAIIHTQNKGLSAARNTGISMASGEFILPLDADDKIAPTYIQKALNAFAENPLLQIVYCEGRYFGEKNEAIAKQSKPFDYKSLLLYNTIFCSALFRKNEFENAGQYNENMRGGWEDWDLWIRLLKGQNNVYQIPEELFFYRVKQESMIQNVIKKTDLREDLERRLFINNQENYFKIFGPPITAYRELQQLREEKFYFEEVKRKIYRSASYRIGHVLLSPVKMIKGLLK